ncbi:N4-gp56 family major capsid protein [uncultured Clostridium sp.]|uniref:N4-gp56 family major capsid protein n=1 Tax=uncultured Clostridium sp. TaxID=59620 RepID=UPI002624B08D|nr:N4-gp56 family major capsid protein [uncultured Clostridium sp.]
MANILINNAFLGEMIGAALPAKLRFGGLAKVDNTLVGQPGDTIKVEKYAYMGAAEKVEEGKAIPVGDLTMTSQSVTLAKAGKGFKLTDEEIQRRGNEVVNEGKNQLTMSIADKIDDDSYAALKTTKLKYNCATSIKFQEILKAKALFQSENDGEKFALYIHPDQEADIILDPGFMPSSKLNDSYVVEGAIGRIAGCDVIKSLKVKKVANKYHDVIVRESALGIKLGKSVGIEDARDASVQTTTWYGSEVYVVYLAKDNGAVELVTTEA